MARGAQKALQARAPESRGDSGPGGTVMATQADAKAEVDQGGANGTTRPDVEVGAGRDDTDSAARPVAGEGETGGGAQERPASQIGVETLVLEPLRAGVEGVAEEESAPGAPAEEETRIPEPAGARDGGVVAAVTAQSGAGECGAGGANAGEQRGVWGLKGHRPCCCCWRRRPDCRVHIGLRGGTQCVDVRGAPSRGDHLVQGPSGVSPQ